MPVFEKISNLWIVILFNMAFADILGFLDSEMLSSLATASTQGVTLGNVDAVVITPAFLLVAAVFIEIAVLMIYLSRVLKRRANRIANVAASMVTMIFIVGGGSLQPHYIFLASVELMCLGCIVMLSWRWNAK